MNELACYCSKREFTGRPLSLALGLRTVADSRARFFAIGFLFALVVAASPANAQPAPAGAQTALDHLSRAVAALGGVEAYRKAMNTEIHCEARATAAQPGLSVTTAIKIQSRADGARRVERELAGQKHVLGTDGKVYWQLSPQGAVSELDSNARAALRMDSVLQALLTDYEALGYSPELAAAIASDLRPPRSGPRVAFVKRSSNPDSPIPGDRITVTFHAETGLPVAISYQSVDPWGGEPFVVTLEFSNYRAIDGAQIAHAVRQLRDDKTTFEITISSVAIDKKHEDSIFAKPNPK